jgi:hypothetical protein
MQFTGVVSGKEALTNSIMKECSSLSRYWATFATDGCTTTFKHNNGSFLTTEGEVAGHNGWGFSWMTVSFVTYFSCAAKYIFTIYFQDWDHQMITEHVCLANCTAVNADCYINDGLILIQHVVFADTNQVFDRYTYQDVKVRCVDCFFGGFFPKYPFDTLNCVQLPLEQLEKMVLGSGCLQIDRK